MDDHLQKIEVDLLRQSERELEQEPDYLMEAMHVDMFSSCFFAMRKKYKKEYKLLNEDQASYFFECMFILAI